MKIFGLCALIFIILIGIFDVCSMISFIGLLKRTEEKYPVLYKNKDSTWLVLSACWIVICIANYFTQTKPENKQGYFYLIFVWAIAFLINLIHFFASRYVYITKNGIILYQIKNNLILKDSFLSADEFSYQMKKSELSVFSRKDRKYQFEIFTNQDEIKEIAEKCYIRKNKLDAEKSPETNP